MTDGDRIAATKTAFELLDVVYESGGASAAELMDATGLSRGGVYKHLRTLVEVGALANRDGVYELGPTVAEYGVAASASHAVLDQTDAVDRLARRIDAPANLWVSDGEECHCRYTANADRAASPRAVGDSERLVESPPGKVMLARLPTRRRTELVGTHNETLLSQLETARERQFLEERLLSAPDWVSIAAPVLAPGDDAPAAIETVVPSERADRIDVTTIGESLVETAAEMQ